MPLPKSDLRRVLEGVPESHPASKSENIMTKENLGVLESEVEQARTRLADDLARLRSPKTFSEFGGALKAQALEVKDDVIEKAEATAISTMHRITDDLKAKAAANPGAALAIGAGLGWRLIRRPPIATVLVGAGLFSLLRTKSPPTIPYMDLYDEDRDRVLTNTRQNDLISQATDTAARVKDKVEEWSADAARIAQQSAETLKETTASVANTASHLVNEARETVSDLSSKTTTLGTRSYRRILVTEGVRRQRLELAL